MKIIDDNFLVCGFCLQAIVNDDYSCLDYYFNEEVASVKMDLIQTGISDATDDGLNFIVPTDATSSFSSSPCECCGDPLHGDRTRMQIILKHPFPRTERSYYI